ncbi:MAG: choice-of-anchor A family protein [Eubacteriales bacterium]|nr:choice-of-anchor A family protein [Eubacteriales bacterium]
MAEYTGVPYDHVVWQTVEGQPFGIGAGYNGLLFGDLTTMVDMEGPIAVAGNVDSYRGMSVSFGRMGERTIPYSATAVRFMAGGNVNVNGALTVVGNVLTAGSSFDVGTGSTYLIGKSGEANQRETLATLYAADGSPYWEPAADNGYYIISSYDVPRRIPASRVNANIPAFFAAAKESLSCWLNAFMAMSANGATEPSEYGYRFRGTNADQNVFDLTWPDNESITGNLTFDVPDGSVSIVRIYGGSTLNLSTPLWGREELARRTLYVLMDAKTVNMTFPTAIYGSILAPDAAWLAKTTGGNINGTAALGSLWVQQGSGFELHWYPFAGGVSGGEACVSGGTSETPSECPICPACPEAAPCPTCPACPDTVPCPTCPACPDTVPCPTCPACPEAAPCPTCPACPTCPEAAPCPACPICSVTSGVISGCVMPNGQCSWRVKLCDLDTKQVLSVWQGCGMGCFSFETNQNGAYRLHVDTCCHYVLRLNNVGVRSVDLLG